MKKVDYDEENDILFLHKGFSKDEKFQGNIDVGSLILDMSTRKRVRGIEILDVSSYLKEFDVKKNTLKSLKDADFTANVKPGSISIGIILKTKNKIIPAKIAIPVSS